jgi:DegT/DnrJ/EryC1/StrS aminotransferase family protein
MDDAKRQAFMMSLRSRGVDSRPYFYPVSDMPMYPDAVTPVAHRLSPVGINLPSYIDLTREDVAHIGRQVIAALDELSAPRRIRSPLGRNGPAPSGGPQRYPTALASRTRTQGSEQ